MRQTTIHFELVTAKQTASASNSGKLETRDRENKLETKMFKTNKAKQRPTCRASYRTLNNCSELEEILTPPKSGIAGRFLTVHQQCEVDAGERPADRGADSINFQRMVLIALREVIAATVAVKIALRCHVNGTNRGGVLIQRARSALGEERRVGTIVSSHSKPLNNAREPFAANGRGIR